MANIKGNGTTIGKFLLIMFATKTLAVLAAKGINLPLNEIELAGYIGIALGFIYSVCDSYFKNNYRWTYFKKLLNIFKKVLGEDEIETKIEDNDPTTSKEPKVIKEDDDEIIGDENEGC